MKKNSYVAIAFIVLIFGIYAVPKIVERVFGGSELLKFEKVPPFEFIDQDNQIVSNSNFENKVYVVEFFFTSCPTICPRMNENMVKIQNEFYGNPAFGIASISIDPERDTPEVLKAYATEKGATLKNWHFLTGDKADVYSFSNNG